MKHIAYKRKPLGNKRFKWKQREFTLSTFNCVAEDMDKMIKNCKEAGFNLLELGWASHEKAWETVEMCEKHGIDLIFQDLSLFGGMMHYHDGREVTEEDIRRVVEKLRGKNHVIGYYIWDEPNRDYLMKEARRQSDIFNKYAPDALLFSVFVPSNNGQLNWENGKYAEGFEEYIKQVEPPVLSFDSYPVGNYCKIYSGLVYTDEKQLDDSPFWIDIAVARNLARKYDLPFWFYYQACGVYETEKFTFSMQRMMMYAAALYGAKGLQSYTATGVCHEPENVAEYPDKWTALLGTGEKGEFFEQQKEIHREFKMLGNTLMALNSRAVYHSSDLMPFGKYGEIYKRCEDKIADSKLLAGELPDRTSVGELCDEFGNNYLFVLNRDFYKGLKAEIPLKEAFNIYEVSREDGTQKLLKKYARSIDVDLACGDAVLFRIQSACDEACTVEYVL